MTSYKVAAGRELRIAISGKSGCGNTTVSRLLAERLGIKLINFTFRQLASEKGISLAQVMENAKTDDSYDIEIDTRQLALARKESCVLASRLAIWMLEEADLKIYLIASPDERSKRILKREGGEFEDVKSFTLMRDTQDSSRYLRLYKIDNDDYEFADLKIDTLKYVPEQIVDIILAELLKRGLIEKAG
ncbi:cytidylate kinase family protein [Treponema parvum]|uniref:Cytidylate kinase n=1 Tax=Treponema parvum TaxID=138851 RepID=A0A975EZL7_9SPIR|nr:cytidylate kinase family protein [Treponema parvum]QTQ11779.1 cytidylate kinase family protein [Treponema parvum]